MTLFHIYTSSISRKSACLAVYGVGHHDRGIHRGGRCQHGHQAHGRLGAVPDVLACERGALFLPCGFRCVEECCGALFLRVEDRVRLTRAMIWQTLLV